MVRSHGSYVWYDLTTPNASSSVRFYCDVVGWTAKAFAMEGAPDNGYQVFHSGEIGIAGAMGTEGEGAGPPAMWLGHVGVDSVDKTAEKAASLGGTVVNPPEDIPGVGRFAVIADPHGAIFSIFSSPMDPGPQLPPASVGTIGWNELYAGNLDEAFAFYAALFGWTKGMAVDMDAMGIYQVFQKDGVDIGGMMARPPQLPMPMWQYYFVVDDINAAAERVRAAGGQVVNGPHPVPGGSFILNAVDPQGVAFSLTAGR